MRGLLSCSGLLLAVLAGACAADAGREARGGLDQGTAAELNAAAGRSLPALSELAASLPPGPRQTALSELIQLPSESYVDSSFGINVNPPNITITAPFGRLGYALYQAGPFDANYQLTQLQLFFTDVQNDYFFFLPDWSTGRWELLGGPRVQGFTHSFGEDFARHLSPAGDFYFAIVTDGGFVLYNHAELTISNLTPLPAPAGLLASAGDGSVQLDWDLYADSRADSIDVYYATSLDLSDAVLSQSLDPAATSWTVEGLDNGTLYFFALQASNVDGASAYSEIASATPNGGGPLPFELAGGMWPRYGATVDSSGTSTALSGPPNLDGVVTVALTAAATDLNRTSPIVDAQGNVYALSRDGHLLSFSSDLTETRYDFDANDHAEPGVDFVCPPHAPCLDADGNVYFVVAEQDSTGKDGYIFGVRPNGNLLFQHNLGLVRDDNTLPYSSPNIGPGGVLLTVADGLAHPLALNQDGSQAWISDGLTASLRFYADPAYNAGNNCFNWAVTFDGFSIGLVQHSISLLQSSGEELPDSDYRDLGTPQNLAGGCALRDDLFVYPENGQLLLIDSTLGLREDSISLSGIPKVGPSRVAATDFIVQPVPPNGVQSFSSRLRCVKLNTGGSPASLDNSWEFDLGPGNTHSRAAIDKDGRIYVADDDGKLWLAYFDPGQPPQEGVNPLLLDSREPDGSNTFYYNSFALGNQFAYIVSQQNQLILIYNPLD